MVAMVPVYRIPDHIIKYLFPRVDGLVKSLRGSPVFYMPKRIKASNAVLHWLSKGSVQYYQFTGSHFLGLLKNYQLLVFVSCKAFYVFSSSVILKVSLGKLFDYVLLLLNSLETIFVTIVTRELFECEICSKIFFVKTLKCCNLFIHLIDIC